MHLTGSAALSKLGQQLILQLRLITLALLCASYLCHLPVVCPPVWRETVVPVDCNIRLPVVSQDRLLPLWTHLASRQLHKHKHTCCLKPMWVSATTTTIIKNKLKIYWEHTAYNKGGNKLVVVDHLPQVRAFKWHQLIKWRSTPYSL